MELIKMCKRDFLQLIAVMGLCVFGGCSKYEASTPDPSTKPNIVFVLIDDISTHELGCYGNTINPTPRIDSLAMV